MWYALYIVYHSHDKNGKILSEGEEVVKRWKVHFEGPYQVMDGSGLYMLMERQLTLEDDLEIMKKGR